MGELTSYELSNRAFHATVAHRDGSVQVHLDNLAMGFTLADGPYVYRATRRMDDHQALFDGLREVSIHQDEEAIHIRGKLSSLDIEHRLALPEEAGWLQEQIRLTNNTQAAILLDDLTFGFTRQITNEVGAILPELGEDVFMAVPFLHRPTDPPGWDNRFDIRQLLAYAGRELRVNGLAPLEQGHGYVPSEKHYSEGWAWLRHENALGIFKVNQEAMEFSILALEAWDNGVVLRFGGAARMGGEPSAWRRIAPGETIVLGETRLAAVNGGYTQVAYSFRGYLDEKGCRFPHDFDPPVHWNELYDNPEWDLGTPGHPPGPRRTRPKTYTKTLILQEAAKAREYGCQALYLDPGWDSEFANFIWGVEWLGDRKTFVQEVWERFGLKVSLHTPLATWMSWDGRSVGDWPQAALRMDASGKVIPGSICLGSQQYLAEAEKRLLESCADGVAYLMFDGNWWNEGCWNPQHGHAVPYTMEDHCRANLTLAQRIHARYPQVLIEMHDMITGGSDLRYTPVYYKYGLPGSYDVNWGFELMWQPMEDLLSGRARALYYYNLACNVPVYLHIDLRDDNEHCLVLWWYASTCRYLGIGGTHEDPRIAQAHRMAMQRYRKLDRFYKRGDFYGFGEEIHVHALPVENAFVVNLFNLSGESREMIARIPLQDIGLARDIWYINTKGGSFDPNSGIFSLRRRLAPWSAQIAEIYALR